MSGPFWFRQWTFAGGCSNDKDAPITVARETNLSALAVTRRLINGGMVRETRLRRLAQMASNSAAGCHVEKLRLFGSTAIEHIGATRVEAATGGRIDRAGNVTLQGDALLGRLRVGSRHR